MDGRISLELQNIQVKLEAIKGKSLDGPEAKETLVDVIATIRTLLSAYSPEEAPKTGLLDRLRS